MPELILLNGPPASGKSTLAAQLVARRPLALNLEIDVVRGSLGAWAAQPEVAGLAARRLAVSMASAHLSQGYDVIIPQLLFRETFLLELEAVSEAVGARFVELALIVDRTEMLQAFEMRSATPESQAHRTPAISSRRTAARTRSFACTIS